MHDNQTIEISTEWRFLVTQELLGLTAEQREQILAHRHIKLVSLARLVQERRELQVKLQVRTLAYQKGRMNQGLMLKLQSSIAGVTAGSVARSTKACFFHLSSRSMMTCVLL